MTFPRRTSSLLALAVATLLSLASSLSICPSNQPTNRREALASASAVAGFALAPPVALADAPGGKPPRELTATTDLSQYKNGPEGLKYLVLEKGSGPKPQRGQKIQTSYTLWINGFPGDASGKSGAPSKQIDSSTKPIVGDSPFKVRAGVSQVIRGWDLTLMDMKEGESRRLVVPPSLGYGDKGVGPIPGKSTLYFEMKLSKVEKLDELSPDAKQWLAEHPL